MPQTTADISADASLAQAKKSAPYFKKLLTGMNMGSGMSPVRETEHNGHHIAIKTTYQIMIDGKPFKGRLGVTNGGSVHYHGLPNAGFGSALDLVKTVIDTFPDEFAKNSTGGMTMKMGAKKMGAGKKPPTAKRRPR
jgi:hypothetical protein